MSATLSTVEAATMLGLTRHCIRLWCESGRIDATKDDTGCYRIPEAAVEWIDRGLVRHGKAPKT